MTKILQQKLSDSATARWTALAIVSFTMMCGYFITDIMAPLESLLVGPLGKGGLAWTSTEYGIFSGAYSWFNVMLLMLFFGGLILDKMGVRFTGLLACGLMLAGVALKYYAISSYFPTGMADIFGIKAQVLAACVGFGIFGMGAEFCGITVSKVIVKWFTGHELALAMGIQVGVARVGTFAALSFSLDIKNMIGPISAPLLVGAVALCIGLIAYLVYNVMDRKLDKSVSQGEGDEEDGFKLSDIKMVVTNRGFWLIAFLCLMFYAGVFPFLKFASKMMEFKYMVDPAVASKIPGLLPIGTMFLTPLFGSLYDRIGKGATLMIIGSSLLVAVHLMFAMPLMNVWWFAVLMMILLGIAFSLVPSAMWPSVPKIVPQKQLGTAYALIFWVQNIGLMMVPTLIGWVIDRYATNLDESGAIIGYNYTYPMLIFAAFGVIAVMLAMRLKVENRRNNYGLEEPNIKH